MGRFGSKEAGSQTLAVAGRSREAWAALKIIVRYGTYASAVSPKPGGCGGYGGYGGAFGGAHGSANGGSGGGVTLGSLDRWAG